jgi:hypothetical protein
MKKVLLLLFIIKFSFPVAAQVDVPHIVANKLSTSFTSPSEVTWNSLSHERYRAEFIEKGVVKSALFSKTGNLLQLIFPVNVQDFPKEVHNSFTSKFPGYEVLEALRVEITQEVTFKVKIQKGREVFEVVFDIFGRVKRQVKIEVGSADAICEKGEKDAFCERHGKKHKVSHNKKEKHPHHKKHQDREMSSI